MAVVGYVKIKCGCLSCGKTFKGSKDGRRALKPAIEHMEICCPDLLAEYRGRGLLNKCQIGCKNCIVPGYEGAKGRVAREYLRAKYIPPASKLKAKADQKKKEPSWQKYDYKLHEYQEGVSNQSPPAGNEETRNLCDILRHKLQSDLMLNAYGVSGAMAPASAWIRWAIDLAVNYPERSTKVWEEHQHSVHENSSRLNSLSEQTREGYSGSMAYITALNFVMQDAFSRCSLPLPPGMDFRHGVALRSDPQYKAQMRAFLGYRHRVFGLIDLIEKNPIDGKSVENSLPAIVPANRRIMKIEWKLRIITCAHFLLELGCMYLQHM
ncbi:hypothetical protein ACHAWF_010212 [Thalassiosira exigua]